VKRDDGGKSILGIVESDDDDVDSEEEALAMAQHAMSETRDSRLETRGLKDGLKNGLQKRKLPSWMAGYTFQS